jgi:hypothetical protein
MKRQLLPVLFLLLSLLSFSQQNQLIFKKGNKVLERYWQGSTFAFQQSNRLWRKGEITRIQNDSFYIRPMVVTYHLMGSDTAYFNIEGYSLSDVFAIPKKGVLISYKNGSFQISTAGGHLHWYWIKSGWLFRTGALGYAGVHTANGLIQNNFSFSKSKTELGVAAGVFATGVLLKKLYKPVIKIGRKNKMEILEI